MSPFSRYSKVNVCAASHTKMNTRSTLVLKMSTGTILVIVLVCQVSCLNDECGRTESDSKSPFPWNVGIYLENENQLELVCFGSVIQSNAILTAAHCFCDNLRGNLRNASFFIATNDLTKNINGKAAPSSLQKINKNDINIHKHYKGIIHSFAYDLAIVKHNFNFHKGVKPVCVDWSGDINDNNIKGKQPIWQGNKVINTDQTYLSSDDCYDASESFVSLVTRDKSCSKTKGTHLSHESEGAGLVFYSSDRWYIKGVVSMHDVTNGELSTYTSVNQYMNWISNICAQ